MESMNKRAGNTAKFANNQRKNKAMLRNHRVMYLRDKSGQPVGAVAIKVSRDPEHPHAQYQVCAANLREDKFDRTVARYFALGRLVEAPFVVSLIDGDATMHEISWAVMQDMANYSGIPSRARQAAKRWLRDAKEKRKNRILNSLRTEEGTGY